MRSGTGSHACPALPSAVRRSPSLQGGGRGWDAVRVLPASHPRCFAATPPCALACERREGLTAYSGNLTSAPSASALRYIASAISRLPRAFSKVTHGAPPSLMTRTMSSIMY